MVATSPIGISAASHIGRAPSRVVRELRTASSQSGGATASSSTPIACNVSGFAPAFNSLGASASSIVRISAKVCKHWRNRPGTWRPGVLAMFVPSASIITAGAPDLLISNTTAGSSSPPTHKISCGRQCRKNARVVCRVFGVVGTFGSTGDASVETIVTTSPSSDNRLQRVSIARW